MMSREGAPATMPAGDRSILLEAIGLRMAFTASGPVRPGKSIGKHDHIALDGLSFTIHSGEVVGLSGESGSGKSTAAEIVAGLARPTSGSVMFNGVELNRLRTKERREVRRRISVVFQNPYDALNPRWLLADSISEPLRIHGSDPSSVIATRVREILDRVGLRPPEQFLGKYPHQLSGGERQRASLARALVSDPLLLIADEPTTMLDVSVRTGLVTLLRSLAAEGLSMLFISHDLGTISQLADRLVVLYMGRAVETGGTMEVLTTGRHPYTQLLLSAIPRPHPARTRVRTTIKSSNSPDINMSRNKCMFAPRCIHRMDACDIEIPELRRSGDVLVACHLYNTPRHQGRRSLDP